MPKCPYSKGNFRVKLSNSFDLEKTAVMGIFEFVSVLKIEVAPFLVGLCPVFARNFDIIREHWVVQARRRQNPTARRILRKDRILW